MLLRSAIGYAVVCGSALGQSLPVPFTSNDTDNAVGRGIPWNSTAIINVKEKPYSAKCDNTTDDFVSLAAAMTAARAKVDAGLAAPVVMFSGGTCLVSQPIPLQSGVTLFSYPNGTVLAPLGTNAIMGGVRPVSDAYVYGLTFDGHQSSIGTKDFLGITILHGTRVIFDNVTFQNFRGGAIGFNGSTQSGLKNSHFNNVGNYDSVTHQDGDQQFVVSFTGPTNPKSFDNFLTGNDFTNFGGDTISVAYQTRFYATNNNLNFGEKSYSWYAAPHGYYAGFYMNSVDSSTLVGNAVTGAAGSGFDIINSDRLLLVGNTSQLNGVDGLVAACTNGLTLIGNRFLNNWQSSTVPVNQNPEGSGIVLGFAGCATDNTVIVGNEVSDNQTAPTQQYGIAYRPSTAVTNVWIDKSNSIAGNKISQFDGRSGVFGFGSASRMRP